MGNPPTRRDLLAASAALLAGPSLASGAASAPIWVVVWDERQPAQGQAYGGFLGDRIAGELPGLL